MEEWAYAQSKATEKLARLHYFSVTKVQDSVEIEFMITVRECAAAKDPRLRYFAQADKQTNQETTPYTPSGWGETLLCALSDCITEIHRFPYQGKS